jgi:hypothetical protein
VGDRPLAAVSSRAKHSFRQSRLLDEVLLLVGLIAARLQTALALVAGVRALLRQPGVVIRHLQPTRTPSQELLVDSDSRC